MYLSDVVIAVSPTYQSIIEQTLSSFDYTKIHKNNAYYFELENISWFEEHPEIDNIITKLNMIGEDSFGFIRLGPELDDNEIHGNPEKFGITVITEVEY